MRSFICTYLTDDNQAFYDQHVARLVEAMDAIEHPTPITVRLGHPVVFYSRKEPRLVCVELLSGGPELRVLAQSVIEALNRACPATRVDAVRALHVTLARFRRGRSTR